MASRGKPMKGEKRPPTSVAFKNTRHDILYSKARYVLNQRHIKRPWFNLNPFLEKTDEQIDLENYLPEESRYIQPLESLVLCESYRSGHPVDTRELAVGSFFPYLYSAEWSDGCSVRVLEGQLLDQLLVCLYRMETKGAAIRHTTFAFAKNKRPLTGCYKLADKTSYGFIEDTLLIEFAYFARLVKPTPNPKTQNPLVYLRHGVPEFADGSLTPDLLPPLQDIPKRKRTLNITVDIRSINSQLPGVNLDIRRKKKDKTKQRSNYLMSKPINAVRALQAMTPKPRRVTIGESATSSGTPMSILQGLHNDKAAPSPAEKRPSKLKISDYKFDGIDPNQILKKFPTYRSVKPPRTKVRKKKKDNQQDTSEDEDEEDGYGDEFYLSDAAVTKQLETVKANLQRKKMELQQEVELEQRRHEKRQTLMDEEAVPGGPVLPPLPPLELTTGAGKGTLHNTIRMPDEVPTFEQFIKILKEDEFYDPRYRNKVRLKTKKIAQRYYTAKEQRRNKHTGGADSLPGKSLDTSRRRSLPVPPKAVKKRTSNASEGGSMRSIRLPPLQESSRTSTNKSKRSCIKKTGSNSKKHSSNTGQPSSNTGQPISGTRKRTVDPANIADEVCGVTDSKFCRDHCIAVSRSLSKPKHHKALARQQGHFKGVTHANIHLAGVDKSIAEITIPHDDICRSKSPARQQENFPGIPSANIHNAGMDKRKVEFGKPRDDKPLVRKQKTVLRVPGASSIKRTGEGKIKTEIQPSSPFAERMLSASPLPPIFPKAPLIDEDSAESADEDINSSDSDDKISTFDAGKVNVKYSMERLRKKQKKKKKKPVFHEILAKYCKVQNTLQTFRKGSLTREMKNAKTRSRRLSLAGFLRGGKMMPIQTYKPTEEFFLGKLRKFEFLEARPKRPLNLEALPKADFAVPCLRDFFKQLVEALDDFVVRREIVVSDLPTYYKSATSVTFTKKSCFTNIHENCKKE